jgi:hypothetical protein
VLAWNAKRTLFHRHEIMHVLAMNLWGLPGLPYGWVSEGLAVLAQGECRGYDLHRLAGSMHERDLLVPIDTLINQFWEQDDVVAYVQAGSFIRYVYEAYGRDILRAVWQHGAAGLVEVIGQTVTELEAEWREHIIGALRSGPSVEWEPSDGC